VTVEQGIQIYVDGQWLYVPAVNAEHADNLHRLSNEVVAHMQVRRVAKTAEGHIVTIHATE
jgi:hypothetical protein